MNSQGKVFQVRGSYGIDKRMTILEDTGSNYRIRVTTDSPYGTFESDEVLSKELFGSCIRTGFINEIKTPAARKVAEVQHA